MINLKILTLNWNGKDKLEKLAPSLISSLQGLNWNWYIKDNASTDNSIQYLQSLNNANINIIQYKDNKQNFSEGCNYLFNLASANDEDYIMLLNNDVIFNDTISIKNMISIIQNDQSVGMVGARLLYTNTNKIQHKGVVFVKNWNTPDHFQTGKINDINDEKNRCFQAITGAVCITKAKYYRNVCTTNKSGINGLDEKLIWCFDDSDACLAIHYNMNKKIVYCGSTNIFHEESASLKKNPMNKLMLNHNLSYFLNKWRGRYKIDANDYANNPNHMLYFPPGSK